MKTPTEILRDEHLVILRALDVMEAAAGRLAAGGSLPEGWWDELLGWLRSFADQNHHAKEENVLFPAMIKAGVPAEGGPVDVMLEEHGKGRALLQALATDPSARVAVAPQYSALLRAHIDKENGVLFPMAEVILEASEQAALAREFQAVAAELGRIALIEEAAATLDHLADAVSPAAVGR